MSGSSADDGAFLGLVSPFLLERRGLRVSPWSAGVVPCNVNRRARCVED